MKRIFGALAMSAALLMLPSAGMADMQVFFAEGAMERETARRAVSLLAQEFPQETWTILYEEETGESLRELVLSDRAPQLAICAPQDAVMWAHEGLVLPLEGRVEDLTRMQRQVVDACTQEETLFMAPLLARHRQMIVNRRLMDAEHLDYMMNEVEHPVWYPTEIYQILEEFALSGMPAIEIWPASPDNSAAIEAFVQALYGGSLLSEDGQIRAVAGSETAAGVTWLRDMVMSGMIVYAKDRQTALEHFLEGKTALFIDWTRDEERLYGEKLDESGMEWSLMPYPSYFGVPVRSFEVVGVAAFRNGDTQRDALALQAVTFLTGDVQAQLVLGNRNLWQDDAVWLPCLSATSEGTTLRRLFCDALAAIMDEGREPYEALGVLDAAMQAAF